MGARRWSRALLGVAAAAGVLAAASLALDRVFPLPMAKSRNLSRLLLANDGTILRVTVTGDHKLRLRSSLTDVDPRFVRMLVAYEDRRFFVHPGIDPLAVVRALKQWAVSGTVVSGASTLTMQVARLLEPRPRTLWSKGVEILRALQLEARLSKREIIEIYLTFAARSETSVRTPLDPSLQVRAEALATAHAEKAGPEVGVAVLMVDHRDAMAVRAWVGSPDYLSGPRLGAIDMVRAIRSPGSTLKPFIYGLAFDRAIAHPNTRLMDASRRFGRYAPGNFDGRYHGRVTVAEALRSSLNIPAVAVMDRLGPNRFAHALDAAGIRFSLPSGERPGLAVALGGVGLALKDLVTLYGALGSDGQVQPLRLDPDAPASRPVPLLSAETARKVAAVLEDTPPPRGVAPPRLLADAPRFAAKTGTSFGFRDAWAVGVDGRYVVGVWTGRVDGAPRPGRIGRDDALPLLHALFGLLPPDPARELRKPLRPLSEPPPIALRNLENGFHAVDPAAPDFALDFPPDGVTLDLSRRGRFRSLPLRAKGGVGDVRWLVNGRPLDDAVWRPDGPGAVTVTALDAFGRSARSTVWVE